MESIPLECDIDALIKSIEDNELNNVMVSCKNTTQLYHILHHVGL